MKYFLALLIIFISSCTVLQPVKINDDEFSYIIYDLKNDKEISSQNSSTPLIPASSLKLFTAFAILEEFKYNHKFYTKIYYQGNIKNNILEGNLIIKGGGDPMLEYYDLFNIAALVKKHDIKQITGKIIYEEDMLLSLDEINSEQPPAKYNTGISALMLRNNYFKVNGYNFTTTPKLDYLNFQSSSDTINVPQYLEPNIWLVNRYNNYNLPVKNSAKFVAEIFAKMLTYNDIKIKNQKSKIISSKKHLLLKYSSKELIDIVRYNLKYSHNATSEILLMHFANRIKCKYNNLSSAAACLNKWYSKKIPELNWADLYWENASGLSSHSNITATHLVSLLKLFHKKQYGQNSAISLLATSSLSGTLRTKFHTHSMQIWAKTGNMYYASGLAGYLFNNNQKYAFAILANDQEKRYKLDLIDQNLQEKQYNKMIKAAKIWKNKIYKKQNKLFKIWQRLKN